MNKTTTNEIWKPIIIDGYHTDYEASNLGRIRNSLTLQILEYRHDYKGYCLVYLRKMYMDDRINRTVYRAHRLILFAFDPIDNADEMTVDHRDKNKDNNELSNLRWMTREDNSKESHKFGREYGKGPDSNRHIHEIVAIQSVCQLIEENKHTLSEISELTGVPLHTVQKIKSGHQWANISCDYNFPEKRVNPEPFKYTDAHRAEIIELLNEDFYNTGYVMAKSSLPKNNATRMFINRIRNKMIAEKERAISSTTRES